MATVRFVVKNVGEAIAYLPGLRYLKEGDPSNSSGFIAENVDNEHRKVDLECLLVIFNASQKELQRCKKSLLRCYPNAAIYPVNPVVNSKNMVGIDPIFAQLGFLM